MTHSCFVPTRVLSKPRRPRSVPARPRERALPSSATCSMPPWMRCGSWSPAQGKRRAACVRRGTRSNKSASLRSTRDSRARDWGSQRASPWCWLPRKSGATWDAPSTLSTSTRQPWNAWKTSVRSFVIRIEVAQQRSSDLARELLQAQAAQRDAASALGDVGGRIRHVARTDPETARALAEAAEHARSLLGSLSDLSSKPHRKTLWRALGPSLGPLLQVLREVNRSSGDDEDAP